MKRLQSRAARVASRLPLRPPLLCDLRVKTVFSAVAAE